MTKNLKFQIFIVAIVLSACINSNSKHFKFTESETITINYKESVDIIDSLFIDINSIRFTHLEDTLGIIGEINKMIVNDNRFIVLDGSQKAIWIFNAEGEFLSKINKIGRGPDEYINAWNILINSNNDIGIVDDAQQSIKWYNEEGSFLKQIKLIGYPIDASTIGNNILVLFRSIDQGLPPSKQYYFHLLDSSGSFKNGFLEYRNPMLSGVNQNYIIHDSDELLVSFPYENKLFAISDNVLSPAYNFDFGGSTAFSEKIKEAKTLDEFKKVTSSFELFGNAHSFQITKNYLTFVYTIQDGPLLLTHHLVYNRKSGKYKNIKSFIKSGLDCFYVHPIASNHKYFYSIVYPYEMSDSLLNTLNFKNQEESSNPFIMQFEYVF